jgi:ribosome-associated protein YbcJ (S4-like RNA binding protein)
VKVDGNVIHEKRKKIYPGSHVILADQLEIEVVAAQDEDHRPETH